MSSWGLGAGWLAVAGTTLLTVGTGAQAWANLAEFTSLRASVSKVATDAMKEVLHKAVDSLESVPVWVPAWFSGAQLYVRAVIMLFARRSILSAIIVMPRRLAQLRAKGGEEAVELVRYLRLTVVWTIIMIGSALALAAAAIQLALAYE
jgi:hypothetical protein